MNSAYTSHHPFFIWLESHPALTTSPIYQADPNTLDFPKEAYGWKSSYKSRIKSINYEKLQSASKLGLFSSTKLSKAEKEPKKVDAKSSQEGPR